MNSVTDSSVPCSVSLQQLVEKTLAPELREKRCDKCVHETAETETKITKLPRVLLLFLKRYKYMAVGGGTLTTTARKVTRLVEIPASISLDSIVSQDVISPDSILAESLLTNQGPELWSGQELIPDSTNAGLATPEDANNAGLATPKKSDKVLATPVKFKGKTEEDLSKLSEEDQTEYLLFLSQKEALTSQGREALFENEEEDEELKAALEASLLEVTGEEDGKKVTEGGEFKTPRKRQLSLSSLDPSPPAKIARHTGGVFSHSTESLLKRADTPSPEEKKERRVSWKKSFHRPESQAEEEADMKRALELSTRGETEPQVDTEPCLNCSESCLRAGLEREESEGEHCYRLTSVVSHFGASTAAGHYVADVHR